MVYEKRMNELPYLIICPSYYTGFYFGNVRKITLNNDNISFTKFLE